jgi:cellulose synthase/poly-beta-1,6-N-acetylglucosamine synthase-like glycosyltransferase
VFEPDAVRALVTPFAQSDVGAVSGNTKVGNRGGLLGRWQHIEYVIGLNLDRRNVRRVALYANRPRCNWGLPA